MLIPCIDLQGGRAVQLVHGKKCELAVDDLHGLLHSFRKFPWLHIIDLDAAMRVGDNDRFVCELCHIARRKYKMKVRVGGGIRTVSRAARVIRDGANQLIIGSAALKHSKVNARFLRRLTEKVDRERIIIALDTAKGRIVVHGWKMVLPLKPENVMSQLEPYCAGFLCTDVDREGTLCGVNLPRFRQLRTTTPHPIIAAGGITTHREIAALEKLGMDAAVGMALYKHRLR